MLQFISVIVLLASMMSHAFGKNEFKACFVKRVVTPPVLDGVFEDTCWQNADRLGEFVKLGGSGNKRNKGVAFNLKNNFEDLPNFDCSPQIENVVAEGKQYKVILSGPLNHDYPINTRIRLHTSYAAPLYWITHGWMQTWKECLGVITGEAQSGAPVTSFWKGTKFVRVFAWFGNYDNQPKPGAVLLIDDIRLVEK
jgi:hypothetical protein